MTQRRMTMNDAMVTHNLSVWWANGWFAGVNLRAEQRCHHDQCADAELESDKWVFGMSPSDAVENWLNQHAR